LPKGDPALVLERLSAPWQMPLQRSFARADRPDYLSHGQHVSHLAQRHGRLPYYLSHGQRVSHLAQRHGRLPYRQRTPGTTLMQLPALLWYFQRWESAAWTLSPQIHLALGPILAQTVWKGFPLLGPGQMHRESPQMSVSAGAGVLATQRVDTPGITLTQHRALLWCFQRW